MKRRDFLQIVGTSAVLPLFPSFHHRGEQDNPKPLPEGIKYGLPYLDSLIKMPKSGLVVIAGKIASGKTCVLNTIRENNSPYTYFPEGSFENNINELLILWDKERGWKESKRHTELFSPTLFDRCKGGGPVSRSMDFQWAIYTLAKRLHKYQCTAIMTYQTPRMFALGETVVPLPITYTADTILLVERNRITIQKSRYPILSRSVVPINFKPSHFGMVAYETIQLHYDHEKA